MKEFESTFRQAGGLSSTTHLVMLPRSFLAGRRAVLGTHAAGAYLHIKQCLTDPREIAAPANFGLAFYPLLSLVRAIMQFPHSPWQAHTSLGFNHIGT